MTQFTKTSSRRKLLKKPPSSEAAGPEQKGRKRGLIIASLIIAVIAVVVGVGYYLIYVAPFQQTIIVMDDASINMRYFLKRIQLAGEDPMAMLETITNELIIKQVAPQPPYNIKVTAEDIDEALRGIARGESGTISDSEFREWYRQQLNESGLSDAEYRDLMYTTLSKVRLHMYLAERVPTVAEQVYLHAVVLDTNDMEEIQERYQEGEDLSEVTKEIWLEKEAQDKVEDSGWLPYGVLDDTFRYAVLNLDVGEVSRPISTDPEQAASATDPEQVTYALLMVSEKADAREVSEDALAILQGKALEDWLFNEVQLHKVEFHGFNNGYDSETHAWINWQLQKMAR